MDVLHLFFGVCGNATALFLFLAPTYGLPFVSKNNILVSTINGAGAAIEIVYVLIFILYAAKKERGKILGLLTLVLAVFAAVALVSLFALHGNTRKLLCGFAATIFFIVMYASPLSIMRVVIKTKSVEYMPFFVSLFMFLCGTSFCIYGLLGHDTFVAVPNELGCGLGALQLMLYFIYRNNKDDDEAKKPNSDHTMEMEVEQRVDVSGLSNTSTAAAYLQQPMFHCCRHFSNFYSLCPLRCVSSRRT